MRSVQDIRSHEEFEDFCHELLKAEFSDYRPVAGEGGDKGIDGSRANRTIVYQIKFSRQRLRPAQYLADLDRVVARHPFREWVLIIPLNPTPRLYELAEAKESQYGVGVNIVGLTDLQTIIGKHPGIREKYFPEVAKEASVRRLYDHVASKDDLRRLERETRAKRPIKLHATPPPGCLTQAHRREITEAVDAIVRSSRRQIQHGRVFAMLKNKFNVDHWYWISDSRFPEIAEWLHRFTYGVKGKYAPRDSTTRLKGAIQSQRRQLALSDRDYRDILIRLTGVDSTTKMDLDQLHLVCDRLNRLIARLGG